ncbi:MAG: 2OG-Fe(II) oxygenase [Acidobacteria bacterium]|nr:2OG-Fe(II) oxygenase [Acidobacteriota bacterium]
MLRKKSLISQKYQNTNLLTKEERDFIKRDFPWTHYVLDGFIEEKPFKRMQKTFLSKKHKFLIKENDPYFVQYALLRYLPLAKVFYSLEFKNLLETFSGFSLSLNTSNYVQVRYMNIDSPELPIHIDTLEGRAIIAIYYLSPNWVEDSGGELCLYDEFEENIPKTIIKPVENRLLFFSSSITTWHSIKKVNNWERYSVLSTWNVKKLK